MSSSHSSVDMAHSVVTEEIDLGLGALPASFDLQSLFPDDRLLRFHPNWFISDFQQSGPSFTTSLKDYVTEEEFPLSGSFLFNRTDDELLHIQLTETIHIEISFLNRDNRLKVQISSKD